MRWEFIGGEEATLVDALRAMGRARGWEPEETAALLAFLGATPAAIPPGAPGARAVVPRGGDGRPGLPSTALSEALRRQPAYGAAVDRIRTAALGQHIILFGDYDADGITAVAQFHRFLAAAGYGDVSWFVPDRMRHGYGLTGAAVEECLRRCRETWRRKGNGSDETAGRRAPAGRRTVAAELPILLVTLDCGSGSCDVIRDLGRQGIDCIVIDHHQSPDDPETAYPAHAHLNPQVWAGDDPAVAELRMLSASGLTFHVCAEMARDFGLPDWDREAALVLAGLGTVADVVPLGGPNRAIVRAALALANTRGFLAASLPGLAKLHDRSGGGPVDARTLGYRWGPRINASGRIDDAGRAVELLLADDSVPVDPLVEACEAANEDRRERTARALDHALRLAEERAAEAPREEILVLWDESWEPGIVGIVAGRLRETRGRPVLVLGKHHGQGTWKGSGRSLGAYDLGAEIRRAVEAGLAVAGGGHPHAAGITVACAAAGGTDSAGQGVNPELERLRAWLNERCSIEAGALEPVHEVLAPVHAREAVDRAARNPADPAALLKFWCELYDRFEPFGAGNPRPGLLLRNAELVACQAKTTTKAASSASEAGSGPGRVTPRVWALSARFRWDGGDSLLADWTDPDAAREVWPDPKTFVPGISTAGRFDLVLEPRRSLSSPARGSGSRTWYDWRVIACAPSREANLR